MSEKAKEINIAKKFFIFQDFFSWLITKIPVTLEHNLAKYSTIKKAFYITAIEHLQGDYYEFGVFTGSSFVCAIRSHNKLGFLGDIDTAFFGFDSFKGFKHLKEDYHPFYVNDTFTIDEKKVTDFIRKGAKGTKFKIIRGFFEDTLKNRTCKELSKNKARIVFIDCDLKSSATLALDYVKPALQEGTIIIMDDFFSYKGSEEKGVGGHFSSSVKRTKISNSGNFFVTGMVVSPILSAGLGDYRDFHSSLEFCI